MLVVWSKQCDAQEVRKVSGRIVSPFFAIMKFASRLTHL